MAYIDFAGDTLLATPASAPLAPTAVTPRHDVVEEEARLSGLEWAVVALAQGDRLSSLAQPGRLSVALGKVFGSRQHNPSLADPRLEALRRMAVLSWHRGFSVPASELKAFLRAGFSAGQYETMAASIVAARPRRGPRA